MRERANRRIGQDLCIALVLAVIGAGLGRPAVARAGADGNLAILEDAMAENGLSDHEVTSVRSLIALAQERERDGDEDGAARAMAEASAILGLP